MEPEPEDSANELRFGFRDFLAASSTASWLRVRGPSLQYFFLEIVMVPTFWREIIFNDKNN
jgi:hypothetical protein